MNNLHLIPGQPVRFYGPAQALIGGEWVFPEVKKRAAFEG